ncbi:MAG: hypothetical protein ACM35H_15375 [Bacteroidota bacterium]
MTALAGLVGLCLAAVPLAAGAAEPEGPDAPQRAPEDLAREGLESMLRALRLLVDSIPQYELPEVLENGDIIIRRKRDGDEPPPEDPDFDETAT